MILASRAKRSLRSSEPVTQVAGEGLVGKVLASGDQVVGFNQDVAQVVTRLGGHLVPRPECADR